MLFKAFKATSAMPRYHNQWHTDMHWHQFVLQHHPNLADMGMTITDMVSAINSGAKLQLKQFPRNSLGVYAVHYHIKYPEDTPKQKVLFYYAADLSVDVLIPTEGHGAECFESYPQNKRLEPMVQSFEPPAAAPPPAAEPSASKPSAEPEQATSTCQTKDLTNFWRSSDAWTPFAPGSVGFVKDIVKVCITILQRVATNLHVSWLESHCSHPQHRGLLYG